MKFKDVLGVSLFGILISSCAANESSSSSSGGGDGGTSLVTYSKVDAWEIQPGSGQGDATDLIFGVFFSDPSSTASYFDIGMLTTTGIFLYENQLSDGSNGWNKTLGRIPSTANTRVDSAFTKSSTGIVYYTSSTDEILELTSTGDATFSSAQLAAEDATVVSMAVATDGSFLQAGSTGVHRVRNSAGTDQLLSLPADNGLKALVGALRSSAQQDFVLVAANSVYFIRNTGSSYVLESGALTRASTATITDAVLANVSGDSRVDLMISTASGLEYFENQSTSTAINFVETTITLTGSASGAVDFDIVNFTDKSFADIIVARNGSAPLYFVGTGEKTFVERTTAAFGTGFNNLFSNGASSDVTDVFAIDIDLNGDRDIVFMSEDGEISVFFSSVSDDG